jgi:hypothetical protein
MLYNQNIKKGNNCTEIWLSCTNLYKLLIITKVTCILICSQLLSGDVGLYTLSFTLVYTGNQQWCVYSHDKKNNEFKTKTYQNRILSIFAMSRLRQTNNENPSAFWDL